MISKRMLKYRLVLNHEFVRSTVAKAYTSSVAYVYICLRGDKTKCFVRLIRYRWMPVKREFEPLQSYLVYVLARHVTFIDYY